MQESVVESILGDGRCDSPGNNAKYRTYTIIDRITEMILDMHVSHVGLSVTSARMELDGLKRLLQRLDDRLINVVSLTTDRHKQVRYSPPVRCLTLWQKHKEETFKGFKEKVL